MSTKNQTKQMVSISLEQVKERIDEYTGTIFAIQAFVSMTTWDKLSSQKRPDAMFSIGRRMTTSLQNRVTPNLIVTPDIVIQVGDDIGYAVEVKYSIPRDRNYWSDDANQLLKYDDNLVGWWTDDETIPNTCSALLIEQGRSVQFIEFLTGWATEHNIIFSQNTSVIEFSKSDNAKPYYFLRKQMGGILDENLSSRLKYGEKIPIEKVVGSYGPKKFYDTEPPVVEYTMTIIWQDVFTPDGVANEYDKKLGGIPLYVKLEDLTLELQKLYGQLSNSPRDVQFPCKDWIRSAMDEFVNIGLGRKLIDNPDGYDYLVLFRQIKRDLLEYFVDSRNKAFSQPPNAKQLDLFDTKK